MGKKEDVTQENNTELICIFQCVTGIKIVAKVQEGLENIWIDPCEMSTALLPNGQSVLDLNVLAAMTGKTRLPYNPEHVIWSSTLDERFCFQYKQMLQQARAANIKVEEGPVIPEKKLIVTNQMPQQSSLLTNKKNPLKGWG